MQRDITPVLGSANVRVDAWVTDRDGRVLRADLVQGKFVFSARTWVLPMISLSTSPNA
ncbi:MAG TPA: hypothetical protein VGL82_11305 [Bryobacteraceae bacterium]|jgi:hypothetical protein